MRVLMFGWEFPPHITGGLGTASYGLTKGMTTIDDVEVIFVVPKAWGDEDQSVVRLIGANRIPVAYRQVFFKGSRRALEQIEISSRIVAGTNPFISGSPYSDLIEPCISSGRRIAQELKYAKEHDQLGEVLS